MPEYKAMLTFVDNEKLVTLKLTKKVCDRFSYVRDICATYKDSEEDISPEKIISSSNELITINIPKLAEFNSSVTKNIIIYCQYYHDNNNDKRKEIQPYIDCQKLYHKCQNHQNHCQECHNYQQKHMPKYYDNYRKHIVSCPEALKNIKNGQSCLSNECSQCIEILEDVVFFDFKHNDKRQMSARPMLLDRAKDYPRCDAAICLKSLISDCIKKYDYQLTNSDEIKFYKSSIGIKPKYHVSGYEMFEQINKLIWIFRDENSHYVDPLPNSVDITPDAKSLYFRIADYLGYETFIDDHFLNKNSISQNNSAENTMMKYVRLLNGSYLGYGRDYLYPGFDCLIFNNNEMKNFIFEKMR